MPVNKAGKCQICVIVLCFIVINGCSAVNDTPALPLVPTVRVSADPSHSETVRKGSVTVSPIPKRTIPSIPSEEKLEKTAAANPTLTFAPALSPDDAEMYVVELLQTNGECRLPCFWGFVPGQTAMQQFQSKLNSLYNLQNAVLFGDTGGGMKITLPRSSVMLETWVTAVVDSRNQSEIIRRLQVEMTAYKDTGTERDSIYGDTLYTKYFQYYGLPSLLSVYGSPEKVFVGAELAAQMGGEDVLYLIIEYTSQGWTAVITMPANQKSKNIYAGCPYLGVTSLQLWAPGDSEMAQNYGVNVQAGYPWSSNEAIGYELEDFYQKFKTQTTDCLEINIDRLKFPR